MKKITMLMGNLAIFVFLVGAIFKMQHFPGANILIIIACLCFSFGYAVPLFIEKNKVSKDSYSKNISFWVMLLMVVFPIAFMFKILHFPYANFVFLGTIGLVIISIPFLIYYAFKTKDDVKKINFQNEMMVTFFLVSCIVIMFAFGKKDFDSYTPINRHVLNEIQFQETKSNELFAVIHNSVADKSYGEIFVKKAKDVKGASDSLCNYILTLEKLLTEYVGQKGWNTDSIENLWDKSNTTASNNIFLAKDGPQKGVELKQKINKYKEIMQQITSDRGKELIVLFFNTGDVKCEGSTISWESDKFESNPLITVITELNQMRSDIRMLEAETMSYIQAMTARAIYMEEPSCKNSCDYLYGCFM
jgi:hypothetical protein